MKVSDYFKFPGELVKARMQSGYSQKAAAIMLELHQSFLCALERGRRPTPSDALVRRFATVLECDPETKSALLYAALHDRVMANILKESELAPVAPLVSSCLLSARDLSPDELKGLACYVAATQAAKRRLLSLSSSIKTTELEEEIAMP